MARSENTARPTCGGVTARTGRSATKPSRTSQPCPNTCWTGSMSGSRAGFLAKKIEACLRISLASFKSLQVPHLSARGRLISFRRVTARTGLLPGLGPGQPSAARFRADPKLRSQCLSGNLNRRVFGQPINGHAHCAVTNFGRELLGQDHYLSQRR